MPAYLTPRHGVSQSEALAEAIAVAPIGRTMLSTYELRHPSLAEPVRLVHDHEALLATLEGDALEDGGVEVEFMASAIRVARPEESDTAASPAVSIGIDNVSGLISDMLRAGRGSRDEWELTERVYASDDTSAPALMPPLTVVLGSVELDGTTAVLTTTDGHDPVNTAVPALTFTPGEYPGLTAR